MRNNDHVKKGKATESGILGAKGGKSEERKVNMSNPIDIL